ncbi:MAG TPA: hypothetical protein VGJ94_13215 [Syntrophorhabdaceae bacterium]
MSNSMDCPESLTVNPFRLPYRTMAIKWKNPKAVKIKETAEAVSEKTL